MLNFSAALKKRDGDGKVRRDAFLYMAGDGSEDFAQCASCFHWDEDEEVCALFGDGVTVGAGDSCGLYVPGEYDGHEVEARVTPEEADYAKSTQVRCENCKYGGEDCGLYVMLNTALPDVFDLYTAIEPRACCNAWTKP